MEAQRQKRGLTLLKHLLYASHVSRVFQRHRSSKPCEKGEGLHLTVGTGRRSEAEPLAQVTKERALLSTKTARPGSRVQEALESWVWSLTGTNGPRAAEVLEATSPTHHHNTYCHFLS